MSYFYAFEGNKDDFKRTLVKNNRHYLDEIEGMTFPELEALSKFLSCSGRDMPKEDYWKHNEAIINATIQHPDTNHYYS